MTEGLLLKQEKLSNYNPSVLLRNPLSRCGSVTEYTQRKVKEMKYIKPTYNNEVIETADIVLTSIIGGGEAKIEATSSTSAKVSASVQSVLGSLYK